MGTALQLVPVHTLPPWLTCLAPVDLGVYKLVETFGLVCSMRDSSWDYDTLGIFTERVNVFHKAFIVPTF